MSSDAAVNHRLLLLWAMPTYFSLENMFKHIIKNIENIFKYVISQNPENLDPAEAGASLVILGPKAKQVIRAIHVLVLH